MRRILYIAACGIALWIYSWQQLGLPLLGWINNYVNNFLCLPLVLGGITQVVRWIRKDPNFQFPLLFPLAMAAYYSIFFEALLPRFHSRYTADWLDVGLYFLGSLCFHFVSRRRGVRAFKSADPVPEPFRITGSDNERKSKAALGNFLSLRAMARKRKS